MTASVLPLGGKGMEEVPMTFPSASQSVTVTVAVVALGLTIATAVVNAVSSQVSVFEVAPASENGTTAS